MFCCNTTNYF